MKRRALLLIAALLSSSLACGGEPEQPLAEAAPRRPNIIVIMTDDAGYSDISSYGGEIPTPNIDALGEAGIRYRKFYTNARCSPTRASLLTGQYPHAVGVGDLTGPWKATSHPGYRGYLSDENVTLAEVLRSAGYHTLMSGKWHLDGPRPGRTPGPLPEERGFEKVFRHDWSEAWKYYFLNGEQVVLDPDEPFYATTAINDHALRFIDEVRAEDERPFFLYVAHSAPHAPVHAPEEEVAKHVAAFRGSRQALREARRQRAVRLGVIDPAWPLSTRMPQQGGAATEQLESEVVAKYEATVAAMMQFVDRGVGQIVAKLRELGELDDTLILFFSDNGAGPARGDLGSSPFYGYKMNLGEGGTASHGIAHWPAVIANAGAVVTATPHVIDLMPTFVELAGATYPSERAGSAIAPMEGESLLPSFEGRTWQRREPLFWELYGERAAIEGHFKLAIGRDGAVQLFDLEADGTEEHDIAAAHPERVKQMQIALAAWEQRTNVLPREQYVLEKQERGDDWRERKRERTRHRRELREASERPEAEPEVEAEAKAGE